VTATLPPRYEVRECRLYRFWVVHPVTGEVVLGYVGETGRQPFERLLEHLGTQPWFDTVVRWEVDPQVYMGKAAVLQAEAAAILAERPLYNVVGNEPNKKRIIPPDAIRQRRERDARAGAQRWVHPDDRSGVEPRRTVRKPSAAERVSRKRTVLVWFGAWAQLAAISAGYLAQTGLTSSALLAASAGIATAMCTWARFRTPDRWTTWRRRLRRAQRWLR
jgi:hypothetical protein